MPAYLSGSLDEADRERAADPGVASASEQPDDLRQQPRELRHISAGSLGLLETHKLLRYR
jgi:hypothetical protein